MEARVAAAIARLERFMAGVDDAWPLPPDAGRFVHAMILAAGFKRGLEIGTSYGYSGLWIASALAENGGTLITIDHDARKTEAARSAFAAAGLIERVDVLTGEASAVLQTISGPIDFVLNDADKENCIAYVETVAHRLSDRAVVMTDNTITHAAKLAEFLAWIRHRCDFFSAHVPVGNGMELSVKRTG